MAGLIAVAPGAAGAGQEAVPHEVRTTKFTIGDVDETTPFYLDSLGMTEVGRLVGSERGAEAPQE
jgi:hypothetical protein